MRLRKQDQLMLAESYEQVSEGLFNIFKKKSQPEQKKIENNSVSESRRTIPVDVYGVTKNMDYNNLMYKSKIIERIGEDQDNSIELKIYETEIQDINSYRDVPTFIPIIVINQDDYPRPPSIIGDVGKSHTSRESATKELQNLAQKYRKNN